MDIAIYHFADGSKKVFIEGKAQKEPEKHIVTEGFIIDVYKTEKEEEQS